MEKKVLIVGAGPIAQEYYTICKDCGWLPIVVGRSDKGVRAFKEFAPEALVFAGGVAANRANFSGVSRAIVAVSEDQLHAPLAFLGNNGVKNILIEKPGAGSFEELLNLVKLATEKDLTISIAYNRRYFASTQELKKRIAAEGGCQSFVFDFTERSYIVKDLEKNPGVKERWFWHNSTHVIDLAFFLGGMPTELFTRSEGQLDWHPEAAIFVGTGKTVKGALFSYHANWDGPGRWSLEFVTKESRYILNPMEVLKQQPLGSMAIKEVPLADELDRKYKPGFRLQTEDFLNDRPGSLVPLDEQVSLLPIYKKILKGNE